MTDILDTHKINSMWQDLLIDQKLHIKEREQRHLSGFKTGYLGRTVFLSLRQHRKKSFPKRTNVQETMNLKHLEDRFLLGSINMKSHIKICRVGIKSGNR